MPSILIVLTSADKTLTGAPTGWYLPEAAHPYYTFAPVFDKIDFAAPKGPNPPLDQGGVKVWGHDEECARFMTDPEVQAKLANAKKLSEVTVADYDAVFYVGGHGPVLDLPFDEDNHRLVSEFWQTGKVVAAVCHGTAALVGAKDATDRSIFAAGLNFTGFSNVEEENFGTMQEIPFLLEDKISALGGTYSKATAGAPHVVVDGKLYTGQNPASAKPLAEAIVKGLVSS
ncbi:Glutathione-independent glyoxalase HSP31 [Mycena kentingensis (nom. inval.)]|nr:Glutathione-independent glyoxalase HSP31 [Mycena kentingensis (nom. inval.)]